MENDALSLVALANELESFIQTTIPKATTTSKYGGTLFTLNPDEKEGQFCGVFLYKEHVQISFSLGAQLNDPEQLLQGNGKFRRHINFKSAGEINIEALTALLTQAASL